MAFSRFEDDCPNGSFEGLPLQWRERIDSRRWKRPFSLGNQSQIGEGVKVHIAGSRSDGDGIGALAVDGFDVGLLEVGPVGTRNVLAIERNDSKRKFVGQIIGHSECHTPVEDLVVRGPGSLMVNHETFGVLFPEVRTVVSVVLVATIRGLIDVSSNS